MPRLYCMWAPNAGVYRGVKNGSTWTWSAFPGASDGRCTGWRLSAQCGSFRSQSLAVGNVDPTSYRLAGTEPGNDPSVAYCIYVHATERMQFASPRVISECRACSGISDTGTSSIDDYTKDQILTFSGNSEKINYKFQFRAYWYLSDQ